jgi:hypothetical protein
MLELVALAATSRTGQSQFFEEAPANEFWQAHTAAAQAAKPSPNRSIVRLSVTGLARFGARPVSGRIGRVI